MDGEIKVELNEEKIQSDAKCDGLKGYVANSQLSKEDGIKQYKESWQIEKAFRISKSDLQIRPIYHRVKRRIEAPICLAFMACKIYKEPGRILKSTKSKFSPEMAIDILKTIYEITIISPYSMNKHKRLILKNAEQQELMEIFEVKF